MHTAHCKNNCVYGSSSGESNFTSNNATLDIRSFPVTSLICSVRPVSDLSVRLSDSNARHFPRGAECCFSLTFSQLLSCARALFLSVYSCVLEAHSRSRSLLRSLLRVRRNTSTVYKVYPYSSAHTHACRQALVLTSRVLKSVHYM